MLSHVLHHHTERDRPGVLGGGEKIALCIRNQISSVLLISFFFFWLSCKSSVIHTKNKFPNS